MLCFCQCQALNSSNLPATAATYSRVLLIPLIAITLAKYFIAELFNCPPTVLCLQIGVLECSKVRSPLRGPFIIVVSYGQRTWLMELVFCYFYLLDTYILSYIVRICQSSYNGSSLLWHKDKVPRVSQKLFHKYNEVNLDFDKKCTYRTEVQGNVTLSPRHGDTSQLCRQYSLLVNSLCILIKLMISSDWAYNISGPAA